MKKRKEFVINFAYVSCILIIVYLIGRYLLPVVVPFIVGFIAASIARKISKALFHNPGKKRSVIVLLALYVLIVLVLSLLSVLLANSLASINLSSIYYNYIEPAINIIYADLAELSKSLPIDVYSVLNQALTSIFDALKSAIITVSSFAINIVTNVLVSVPSIIINVTVVIVSSVYFVMDYDQLIELAYKYMSDKFKELFDDLSYFINNKIVSVIKSYMLIMAITFGELLIGLLILRVENTVLVSAIIALLDILPILGVGTVLIPWGFIELIFGEYVLGIGILVLYGIITAIRNFIEPRIVGGNLGLPPLLSLVGMIVGLGLFGFLGMLGFPLAFSFFIYRYNKKNNKNEEEVEESQMAS